MRKSLIGAALLLAAVLHIATSLGNPIGPIEDDSVQVLLARSLRHGSFALPDAGGTPVTDPLPGFALVLLLPVWIIEPAWGALRAISLLSLSIAVLFTWRLAGRFLPGPWAAAAAVLTAFNPIFVRHAGLVLPDLTYLALTLVLLDFVPDIRSRKALFWLWAGSALAALLRPQGAFFAMALAIGVWDRDRKTAKVILLSLLPLAGWMIRNMLVSGTPTGYFLNWMTQAGALGDAGALTHHAWTLVISFFGRGLLALDGMPPWLAGTAGLSVLCIAGYGAFMLNSGPKRLRPIALSMAAYAGLILVLHLTWDAPNYRYMMPLVPIMWIFILCAAKRLLDKTSASALLALMLILSMRVDLDLAVTGLARPRSFQPETMAWLRENTPPGAGVESLRYNAVLLLGKRRASPPPLHIKTREQWAEAAASNRIDFLHVEDSFRPGGFLPPRISFIAGNLETWARRSPGVREVFKSESEGTTILSLPPRNP